MCGIAGIYSPNGEGVEPEWVKQMTNTLLHRGPNDEGYMVANTTSGETFPLVGEYSVIHGQGIDNAAGDYQLILGHRRLPILDLSPVGHQPMSNETKQIWIVYNGEIYNYVEIADELSSLGHRFASRTDTEMIIHAYEEWGPGCLSRFNGMWAFALWDNRSRILFCARDRMGIKPFYYMFDGNRFCFASEIKALLGIEGFQVVPNEQMVADYLFSGFIDHTQETFFNNIHQLRAGCYLLIESNRLRHHSYWDVPERTIHYGRDEDYAERFLELLRDAIRLRLRTDVPIGSCLSGGLDSSSIVCLANQLMIQGEHIDPALVGERQKTFSSCFDDSKYDERRFIELVIQQTGAEKNYVFPKAEALLGELPRLVWQQDEPFGSTSVYAQWCVMRLAKERGVTVLLDGQGADELLAGYFPSFYFVLRQALRQWRMGDFFKESVGLLRSHGQIRNHFIAKAGSFVFPKVKGEMEWSNEAFRRRYFREIPAPAKFEDDLKNYLYHLFRYVRLPGLLHYEDRNSMAFSIETRLPFLDYRVVEYLFGVPSELKIRRGVTKVLLRESMKKIIPEVIRNRRDKMAFGTPESVWFKTVLKEKMQKIFESKEFADRGYWNAQKVKEGFVSHCEEKRDFTPALWRYLNLEMWLGVYLDKQPVSYGINYS